MHEMGRVSKQEKYQQDHPHREKIDPHAQGHDSARAGEWRIHGPCSRLYETICVNQSGPKHVEGHQQLMIHQASLERQLPEIREHHGNAVCKPELHRPARLKIAPLLHVTCLKRCKTPRPCQPSSLHLFSSDARQRLEETQRPCGFTCSGTVV